MRDFYAVLNLNLKSGLFLCLADLRQRPGLQENHPGAAPGDREPLGHRQPQLQHGQSDQLGDELGGSQPP